MSRMFQRFRFGRLAGIVLLALLSAAAAFSQERADCRAFRSAILHTSVRYCVFLPASYSSESAKTRLYPVLYVLHGLGGNEQSMAVIRRMDRLAGFAPRSEGGRFSGGCSGRMGHVLHQFAGRQDPLRRFLPSRIHAVHRTHVPCSDRNAPPAASLVFRWEATERCASHSRIPNCSARSALTARH